MKLAYLLQTVKGVPLGCNVCIYIYGLFDWDVLNDIGQAESMRAIVSTMIPFDGGGGYGYEFASGSAADQVQSLAAERVDPYRRQIEWMLDKFGGLMAADLELLSTIVYAAQGSMSRTPPIPFEELARQVQDIKPRFSKENIMHSIDQLDEMGLLRR